jgi:hypothetical protein
MRPAIEEGKNMRRLLSLSLGISLWLTFTGQSALAQNGACCSVDGSCTDTNQGGCDLGTGEFLGEGTTCATTVCMGACCLDEKTCAQDSRDGCDGSGGTFQGPNTTCERHCPAKLSTEFNFQGQLKQAGVPLSGTADVEFSLWTSTKGGDQVEGTVLKENISVANGLFSVPLDFGVSVFNGNARWLEIAVRSPHDETDTELFTTLLPRQLITATPYALQTRGLFVSDVGNVGIGTSSPADRMHVKKQTTTSNSPERMVIIDSHDDPNNFDLQLGSGSGILFKVPYQNDSRIGAAIDAVRATNVEVNSETALAFSVSQNDETLDEAMRIDQNGNVGIGTTAPLDPLHVTGSVRSEGGAFRTISPSGDGEVFLGWGVDGNGDEMARIRIGGASPGGTNGLDIQRTGNVSLMRITHDGNVGIGTTPNNIVKLEIAKSSGGVAAHANNYRSNTSVEVSVGQTTGVMGSCSSDTSEPKRGVYGWAVGNGGTKYGVYGRASGSGTNWGGYFLGDVHVTGNLSASGAKPFRIDHPLDPESKYLYHYALESPEVLNLYRGTVVLDAGGEGWTALPSYFQSINRDFTYQLTAVGAPMPNLHVAKKIAGTTFKISGGVPGKEVSWQVTCRRDDPYVRKHGAPVEVEKPELERGFYQHPELYGQPEDRGIDYLHRGHVKERDRESARPPDAAASVSFKDAEKEEAGKEHDARWRG